MREYESYGDFKEDRWQKACLGRVCLEESSEPSLAKEVMEMELPGARRRGRPRTRWKDVEKNMRDMGLMKEEEWEREKWKGKIASHTSDP